MFGGILETAYVSETFRGFQNLTQSILFMTSNGCGNKRNVYKLSVVIKKNFSQTYGEKIYFVYRK